MPRDLRQFVAVGRCDAVDFGLAQTCAGDCTLVLRERPARDGKKRLFPRGHIGTVMSAVARLHGVMFKGATAWSFFTRGIFVTDI